MSPAICFDPEGHTSRPDVPSSTQLGGAISAVETHHLHETGCLWGVDRRARSG